MTQLSESINQSQFNIYFLIVDQFLDLDLDIKNFIPIYAKNLSATQNLKKHNQLYFCLEDKIPSINIKNSSDLLSHPYTQHFINETSKNNHHLPAIMPFKPSAKIDLICKKNKWLKISNDSQISRPLENKIYFTNFCQKLNIPLIPNVIGKITEENFHNWHNKFGENLIIQTGYGWAGNSTKEFQNWKQIESQIPKNAVVKVTPLLPGYTLTNNSCITNYGLVQSPPGLQFTGIQQLTDNPYATVGRQWPSFSASSITKQLVDITSLIGKALADINYKGYFGLDFFVSDQKVYLLECNPRLTASFNFYHHLETTTPFTPLLYLHLAQFLNINYPINIVKEQSRCISEQITGSQLVKRNSRGQITKLIQDNYPYTLDPTTSFTDLKIINRLSRE